MGEFRHDIHKFRGVAIVLVVVSHAAFAARFDRVGDAVSWITRGGTWPFLFVAGFLMAHLAHRYDYLSYLKGKGKNVIVPYVLVVSLILIAGIEQADTEIWNYYLRGYQAVGPLWFIPLMALFYLLFPVYSRIPARVSPALALFSLAAAIWMERPDHEGLLFWPFVYFQSAYLCGIAWAANSEKFDRLAQQFAIPILALFAFSTVYKAGEWYSMPLATAVILPLLKTDSPLDPLWNWLGERSFGIFFLHGLVTEPLTQYYGGYLKGWAAILVAITLLAICGLIVDGVRKVAGKHSRLVVGA